MSSTKDVLHDLSYYFDKHYNNNNNEVVIATKAMHSSKQLNLNAQLSIAMYEVYWWNVS